MTAEPLLSVVIASVNGLPAIEDCLTALSDQAGDFNYEVVVVDCCDAATRDAIRRFDPDLVSLIEADGRPSIPRLRAIGIAAARGRMVAILEDHCNVSGEWVATIARAERHGVDVLGGAVENGSTQRLIDWAVFFCEYARFMLPLESGVVPEITGNNSVYSRRALDALGQELQEELWEGYLHQRLSEQGFDFYCDPELWVSHVKEFGFLYFLSQRYHYSRSFAGMRLAGATPLRRALYAAATPLLPPLLFLRITKTVLAKGRHRDRLLLSAPLIGIFLLSWAWGEAVGALLGPGDSLARVE